MRGSVIQINISSGGLPKTPIERAIVDELGILGDGHRNMKHHGGPRRALLLVAAEAIDTLKAEGWPLFYGALGENLTTRGLDYSSWRSGQRYQAGGVVLELTSPRGPCGNLNSYGAGIHKRIYDERVKVLDPGSPYWGLSGFYASILKTGELRTEDIIELIDPVV
ncbi:MAG TPA: MOSC domain-containing protein [Bryobacteraceae bacterium]|jgi:MOSC domain-containing protein YiiM|nr:MOSC domain-containing protein [Bryobacteraceae bacterium]